MSIKSLQKSFGIRSWSEKVKNIYIADAGKKPAYLIAKPFLEFNCANESLVIRILGENTAEPMDFIFILTVSLNVAQTM